MLELTDRGPDAARISALDWSPSSPPSSARCLNAASTRTSGRSWARTIPAEEDILLIVEPVLMAPLRRRWAEVKAKAEDAVARGERPAEGGARQKPAKRLRELLWASLTNSARPGA